MEEKEITRRFGLIMHQISLTNQKMNELDIKVKRIEVAIERFIQKYQPGSRVE